MAGAFGDTPLGLVSQILNLAAVLTRKAGLKVPRYQRPYSWTEREVRQLIQDLWRAYKRRATFYFIGQIVLVKNNQGKLEISDGQQRLATLTMIFAYVRDRLPGRAKQFQSLIMDGDTPRLMLREEDASFYRGFVQEPGRMSAMAKHAEIGIDSRDLLCAAARTIDSELQELDDREIDSFMSYVARACTINVVDADERGCAATVYNTVNDRGLELSAADNLKSDLLESSGLTSDEADKAARQWEQIEDLLSRDYFADLLNLMPFLLTGEQLVSPGDLVSFRDAVERSGGVRKFLFERLPRYAHVMRSINYETVDVGNTVANVDVNRRLHMMKQLKKPWRWAPPALAFLAEHSGQPERARRFFRAIDRFAFACELPIIDNRRKEARFERAMRHAGDDSLLYGPKGALELTDGEHMKFIARLNHPTRNANAMQRLLMLRLEAAMKHGSLLGVRDDVTIEHVLPRGGGAWWNDRFPDPKRRADYAHLIGNLVLVTYEQNERADNKAYPDKKRVFFNTPGAPIHAVTKDIAGIEEWTFDTIEERHERLVRILSEDWGLVRGDASQAA